MTTAKKTTKLERAIAAYELWTTGKYSRPELAKKYGVTVKTVSGWIAEERTRRNQPQRRQTEEVRRAEQVKTENEDMAFAMAVRGDSFKRIAEGMSITKEEAVARVKRACTRKGTSVARERAAEASRARAATEVAALEETARQQRVEAEKDRAERAAKRAAAAKRSARAVRKKPAAGDGKASVTLAQINGTFTAEQLVEVLAPVFDMMAEGFRAVVGAVRNLPDDELLTILRGKPRGAEGQDGKK